MNTCYENRLETLLRVHNVCSSHGIGHALEVQNHAIKAIQANVETLSEENVTFTIQ
jgi:hypothetical protein